MNENQIIIALMSEVGRQLELVNFGIADTDFMVSRNQQPTNQFAGADNDSEIKTQIYLRSISDPVVGKSRVYKLNQPSSARVDLYHKRKILQISVLHAFDESDVNAIPPETVAQLIHDLIESPDCMDKLRESGVFVQETTDVRPVFTVNESSQYESTPNFDLTITYTSSISKSVGTANAVDATLVRV